MESKEIRKKFLEFFEKRGHKIVPSSSLISDDPSVLLTTAGMQQFKPYFIGKADPIKDFGSKNVVSIQKCFRTSDIDEVGDESHLTFFEMLGNFSFGGYGKKEAIEYAHEFITKEMGLKIDYVTVFAGEDGIPADEEAEKIWKTITPDIIVKKLGRSDNFWGPTGNEGPCGPTSEIFVEGSKAEIWNLVFNEYYSKDGELTPLKTRGIDTGMGLERLTMAVQRVETIFDTDLFKPSLKMLPNLSNRFERIVVDHVRGVIFLLADGVRPSNKEAGYILRRLIRRLFFYEKYYALKNLNLVIEKIIDVYYENYREILINKDSILEEINIERNKFSKSLDLGIKKASKLDKIDSKIAFRLYETEGLFFEILKEIAEHKGFNLTREDFEKEFKKHQEISRAGSEKKFGGHGLVLDTGEIKAGNDDEMDKVTRLHTATHLLQRALREVLGNEVEQRGSDITPERTRFDFSFARKLTQEEIKKVEDLVNRKIKEDLPVNFKEMPIEEAKKTGALFFFREKYPETVKVYFTGEKLENAWSKEFCGGPHVRRTSEIGNFKILKEESVAAGIRRIRATVS